MNATLSSVTFHAKSVSAPAAAKCVSDEIMCYARDNNCSIVTISHAMIQRDDVIETTAIAIFQTTAW